MYNVLIFCTYILQCIIYSNTDLYVKQATHFFLDFTSFSDVMQILKQIFATLVLDALLATFTLQPNS
jgi:hypothetical protein